MSLYISVYLGGRKRIDAYRRAAVKAGYVKPSGSVNLSAWIRDIIDNAISYTQAKGSKK